MKLSGSDDLRYREFKILLTPQRLYDRDTFDEYWSRVVKIAESLDIEATSPPQADTQTRWVTFYDTPERSLESQHFLLRQRTTLHQGWPEKVPETTLKFRSFDHTAVQAQSVVGTRTGKLQLKEQMVLDADPMQAGPARSVFSHNYKVHLPLKLSGTTVGEVSRLFSALSSTDLNPNEKLDRVGRLTVEELQANMGRLRFGKSLVADANLALWRDRASAQPMVGEFAFELKFEQWNEVRPRPRERAQALFNALQGELAEWCFQGTTKTRMLYDWQERAEG